MVGKYNPTRWMMERWREKYYDKVNEVVMMEKVVELATMAVPEMICTCNGKLECGRCQLVGGLDDIGIKCKEE